MPQYRRAVQPGGTFFFSIVAYRRRPIFQEAQRIDLLRRALKQVIDERPFEISAAVILPDHMHFIWKLPEGDSDFSRRAGRLKALYTKSLPGHTISQSASRAKHRESDVWQRRFWEHVVRDKDDFGVHLDYVHYNPVKHGYVSCPHLWPYSSFAKWVRLGVYPADWQCVCGGRRQQPPQFPGIHEEFGE